MNRIEKLKAVLRPLETAGMKTADLADLCTREVPGCAIDEIIEALRSVALEHRQEAESILDHSSWPARIRDNIHDNVPAADLLKLKVQK